MTKLGDILLIGYLDTSSIFRYQALNDPIAHAQRRSVKDVLLKIFYVWFFSVVVSLNVILEHQQRQPIQILHTSIGVTVLWT